MSGAGLVRQVFEMPQSGRVLQVGVPAVGAWRWQGSQRPFECLRVVPSTDRPRKQRRAFPILMKLSAGLCMGGDRSASREGSQMVRADPSGKTGLPWLRCEDVLLE